MSHFYTWDKLAKNSARLNPKTRGVNYPATPKFERILILPYVGTKSCLVKLQAYGVTQANNMHQVTLLFNDCEILTGEQDVSLWDYFKIEYKGEVYYVKKFDRLRNPLTSRCTCFTGDTKIILGDGTSKRLDELVDEKNFEVISYNEDNDRFEKVNAIKCELKAKDRDILRVTLDNNTHIDCTPEHLFLTREGKWFKAEELKSGMSLRALYGKKHRNTFKRILNTKHKQAIKQHEPVEDYYVYIYLDPRKPGLYKYKTCEFDYEPIYVGKGHRRRAFKHLKTNTKDYFHCKLQKIKKDGYEPIILKYSVNLTETVAFRIENELTNEIGLLCEGKGPLLNCKHGGEGGLNNSVKLNTRYYMLTTNLPDTHAETRKEKAFYNHKVISVEKIGRQDVYCLTTEYLGNFVVNTTKDNEYATSGVVVSNCKDFFFSWAWYNYYRGHCLYGPAPKPYRRKTTTRPPRNPNGYIGICKHVYNAWDYLKREGLTLN